MVHCIVDKSFHILSSAVQGASFTNLALMRFSSVHAHKHAFRLLHAASKIAITKSTHNGSHLGVDDDRGVQVRNKPSDSTF